ncbi:4-hydroxythreonine-4-phosphate dehydrogenase PdxA [Siphonobacter sp. SORGH_AS_1065]|uniref:4-hydroxythreonine-4-phosphate dehydrogenase PdxA n=1 Tax=Siphonobacter sp. SORGH_AS_1065 TaxID=3041795 RepID=UPI00278481FA|nr:4-hydroxythreonine-4-phosphate dehydrogenase PdxA [Siphonobacter sp. SORGH_AS_1065]MDQ1088086.1 4-hydroxythreonine-4-phosphate dehydrogenase [Siphonobacter sp. SORGH_AS_1065]
MSEQAQKPIIGISMGDYNGIGPEVILKALHGNHLNKHFTPVIYGSMRVLNRYKHLYDMKDWQLNPAPTADQLNHKMVNVITCFDDSQTNVEPGKVQPEAGQAAFQSLSKAVEDLKAGLISALVTAPINKYNIQSEEFKFPGHTEYLAEAFQSSEYLMFMVSERLKIGVVTGHVPLGRVRSNISQEAVSKKLNQIIKSLHKDFGINKPRIAVLGLNPHAGEDGLLGNEEKEVIIPVIEQYRKNNHLVYGPFPADGFFGASNWKKFDAILAMYHDQGLMPFKMLAFEDGVNFTSGLSIVRTSPDHGTAYDIAGKNLADHSSMLHAIYTALDIVRNRKQWDEIEADKAERANATPPLIEIPTQEERDPKLDDEIPRERPQSREERPQREERKRDNRPAREERQKREDRQPREEQVIAASEEVIIEVTQPTTDEVIESTLPTLAETPVTEPPSQAQQPRREERQNDRPRREDRQNRNNRFQRNTNQERQNDRQNRSEQPTPPAATNSEDSQQPRERPRREDRQNQNRANRFQRNTNNQEKREEPQSRQERRETPRQPKPGYQRNQETPEETQRKLLEISQSLLFAKTPSKPKTDENPEA